MGTGGKIRFGWDVERFDGELGDLPTVLRSRIASLSKFCGNSKSCERAKLAGGRTCFRLLRRKQYLKEHFVGPVAAIPTAALDIAENGRHSSSLDL